MYVSCGCMPVYTSAVPGHVNLPILKRHIGTGQEREQTQGRTSEVVDTKERVVEVTQADPCGGVPTGAGGVGSGVTGSRTGTGTGTGTEVTGAGSRTNQY